MPRMPYELFVLAAQGEITLTLSPQVIGDVQAYVAQKEPEHLTRLENFLADEVMGYSHDALTAISQRRWEDLGETVFGEGT